jgi:hypothetical protein
MGWTTDLEDKYTVKCKHCGMEYVDPGRKPAQKYLRGQSCVRCGKSFEDKKEGKKS